MKRERQVDGTTSDVDITTDGPVLILRGDLDVRTTAVVRSAVYQHLETFGAEGAGRVLLDVTGVRSIDATALKVLAAASRQARSYGVRVVLRGACPTFLRMLHLTRLIRLIEVERDAVAV